jgi:hypothetical protein
MHWVWTMVPLYALFPFIGVKLTEKFLDWVDKTKAAERFFAWFSDKRAQNNDDYYEGDEPL